MMKNKKQIKQTDMIKYPQQNRECHLQNTPF